ncbi:MAG: hypothetical protein V9F04_10455 [Dermatophilaceae bacterium]
MPPTPSRCGCRTCGSCPHSWRGCARHSPATIGDSVVTRIDDLARGDGGLPPTDGLRYFLSDGSRVIVRPSGTEPKVKVYLEAVEDVPGSRGLGGLPCHRRGPAGVDAASLRGAHPDLAEPGDHRHEQRHSHEGDVEQVPPAGHRG